MSASPPRTLVSLLALCLPDDTREDLIGDLEESFRVRAQRSRWRARLWYAKEALSLALLYGMEIQREQHLGSPSEMLLDIRYACRSLLKRPVFAAVVVLTLGLGIGANTAVFSFVQAILIRPMPYPASDRLVVVRSVRGEDPGPISLREVEDFRETGIFESVAAYFDTARYNIAEGGEPELVRATVAARELFETLGVGMRHGDVWPKSYDLERSFGVVLSHDLWQRRFRGDPAVIGTTMTMDGAPGYTIFGVLPPEFAFPMSSGVFRCIGVYPDYTDRNVRYMSALGRLSPDLTIEQAQARLDTLGQTLSREFPATNAGVGFRVEPLRSIYVGDIQPYLVALWGAVLLILLLVSVNLVNLLLARATTNQRQYGVMAALGAARGVLMRRLLAESVLLAALGGLAGVAFGAGSVSLLQEMIRGDLPYWMEVGLDWQVLAYALGLALTVGVLAGLAPAVRFSRPNLTDVLHDSARGSAGGRRYRTARGVLVSAQVAIAAVLLIGAGLTVQSFQRLQQTSLGFDSERLLTLRPMLNWRDYRGEDVKANAFFRQAIEGIRNLPGVEGVAAIDRLPLSGRIESLRNPFLLEGQSVAEQETNPYVLRQLVTPGFFELVKTPVVEGRTFNAFDDLGGEPVALVSRSLAQRLWQGLSPLDRRIRIGKDDDGPWRRIVGVVGDVKYETASGPPDLTVYTPLFQSPRLGAAMVVRTKGDPLSMAEAAKRVVWSVDPLQGITDVASVEQVIADSIWQHRVSGTLFALFALLAAVVAALGVYGVLSHLVAQRRREIGIRMALGAGKGDALRLVLRDALRLAAVGVCIGLAAALGVSQSLSAVLYEVSPTDWATYGGVAIFLMLVAVFAALIPARRAARVEPIVSLRSE